MYDIDRVARRLILERFRPTDALSISSGVYALFLENPDALPGLPLGADQPLYIGMTDDRRKKRNHFDHADSGGSSPRRSLGALLKEQLRLQALPRSDGNCTNYRFNPESEAALTAWMRLNLSMSHVPLDEDKAAIKRIEEQLLVRFDPPLNLSGVPQSDTRRRLSRLCKACGEEARGCLTAPITR